MNIRLDLIELISKWSPVTINGDVDRLRVYHDLGICGDDADEMMEEYSRRFNIPLQGLILSDYFPSEGDPLLPALVKLFGRKEKAYKALTIGQLQQCIVVGDLSPITAPPADAEVAGSDL